MSSLFSNAYCHAVKHCYKLVSILCSHQVICVKRGPRCLSFYICIDCIYHSGAQAGFLVLFRPDFKLSGVSFPFLLLSLLFHVLTLLSLLASLLLQLPETHVHNFLRLSQRLFHIGKCLVPLVVSLYSLKYLPNNHNLLGHLLGMNLNWLGGSFTLS
jgi:hypothetical protein